MPGFISNNKAGVQRSNVNYTNQPERHHVMARATLATAYSNNLHQAGFDEILTKEEMEQVIDELVTRVTPPQTPEELTSVVKGVLEWRKDNLIERDELWLDDDSNERQDQWTWVDNNGKPIDCQGNPLPTDEELLAEYYREYDPDTQYNEYGYRAD